MDYTFEVTAGTGDSTPPLITSEHPTGTISSKKPDIGANYSDSSGIDVSSVIINIDSTNVSSSATKTAAGV
jgi:hypothetical protein